MAAVRCIACLLIGRHWLTLLLIPFMCSIMSAAGAQDKLTFSYAALGGPNSIWNIAKDVGFYKKHGLEAEVVYIASTTLSAAAVLSGHIQVGMVAGSGVVNAAASGADLVSVACFVNVLDYELVVHPSIHSAEGLKGKSIGISRFGSVTDVAVRASWPN
jgi:NitT/TauT family transport system substrate-binding protein